jgi:hypothetical protein
MATFTGAELARCVFWFKETKSCLANFLVLKMQAVCSFKMSGFSELHSITNQKATCSSLSLLVFFLLAIHFNWNCILGMLYFSVILCANKSLVQNDWDCGLYPETDQVSKTFCFLVFRILDDGQSSEAQ